MTYSEELQGYADAYCAAINYPLQKMSGVELRRMHEELCRMHSGLEMTADEIIADWNRRSPEDQW